LNNILENQNLPYSPYYWHAAPELAMGWKKYEVTNHLGNVLSVLSDRKKPKSISSGIATSYDPVIISAMDYYPFGLEMEGRTFTSEKYRFSFNGKEKDNEILEWQDYGMRMYMIRLGRFLSVDPLSKKYPFLSPYQFASNNPIGGIDLDGLEFANPQLLMKKEYPVLKGISDGISESLTYTWNFVTHDAYTPEPYVAAWNLYSEFTDMMWYGTSGNAPQPTPGMDAIAKSIKDDIINGDAYSRSKIGARIGTDIATAYVSSKGMSALTNASKVAARTSLAKQFYKKAGYDSSRAASHIAGINFNNPVQTITLKKGTIVQQWVKDGKLGNYFTNLENGAAQNLGITYGDRTLIPYTLTEDVKVLKSTAADLGGNAGGGVQYFSRELKDKIIPVNQ
jgi:RHS repeat-associated protein